jgi:hypothetical protein
MLLVAEDFQAKLVVYVPASVELPSGIPGDPAQDYGSKRSKACGKFSEGMPAKQRGS